METVMVSTPSEPKYIRTRSQIFVAGPVPADDGAALRLSPAHTLVQGRHNWPGSYRFAPEFSYPCLHCWAELLCGQGYDGIELIDQGSGLSRFGGCYHRFAGDFRLHGMIFS